MDRSTISFPLFSTYDYDNRSQEDHADHDEHKGNHEECWLIPSPTWGRRERKNDSKPCHHGCWVSGSYRGWYLFAHGNREFPACVYVSLPTLIGKCAMNHDGHRMSDVGCYAFGNMHGE